MIGSLISAVATVLTWILGVIADVAYGFSRLSYYATSMFGEGNSLAYWLARVGGFFNDLYFDFRDFRTRLQDVLWAIDDWLDKLADLRSDVYGWITDKLGDAYYWADRAWDWIVDTGRDLYRDVHGWIMDRIDNAYYWADRAWDWVIDTGRDLYNDVHGWIMDRIDDAYAWASDAWDWIVDNAAKLEDIPQLIRDEVLAIVGPAFNLVEFFFEDISDFFSDPADYFDKRLDRLGTPFAERLWAVIEKILEKVW